MEPGEGPGARKVRDPIREGPDEPEGDVDERGADGEEAAPLDREEVTPIALDAPDDDRPRPAPPVDPVMEDADDLPDAFPELTTHGSSLMDKTPIYTGQSIHLSASSSMSLATATSVSDDMVEDLLSGEFPSPRYEWKEELGSGGMGRVGLVKDRLLGREVALKVPLPQVRERSVLLKAFIQEALLTARLEHPNIVPVYDFVVQEQGVGYVMRRLEGNRLAQILNMLAAGERETVESYGRVRLLTIFQQIVSAMAFAHDHGIIHRDLKPNNVIVGAYGEVQVLDWGLACGVGPSGIGLRGAKVGQAPYMSPEVYRGDDLIDHRSDIYALGAVLYEILTLEPIHQRRPGESREAFMARCAAEDIVAPSLKAPTRQITPGLDEICMRCLRRDPDDRYSRAKDLLTDVVTVLEGTREREFRMRAAENLVTDARRRQERYLELYREVQSLTRTVREQTARVKAWDPLSVKRRLWAQQDRLKEADNELSLAFHETENAFRQALGQDPSNEHARQGLLEFYYQRFLREERENGGGKRYFHEQVQAFGDETYNRRLQGDGILSLTTHPSGARVTLYRYEEVDRILRPVDPRPLGKTPVERTLPMGSYVLMLEREGYRSIHVPVHIGRLESAQLDVDLFTDDAIGAGFRYVPAGTYIRGGDVLVINPVDAESVWVDNFAIATYPVTTREYMRYLNALWEIDPERAARAAPQVEGRPLWPGGTQGPFTLPDVDAEGDAWTGDMPMCRISWDQAMAYCAWLGEIDGRTYRVPTGDEWEKAGRGVDGRGFPWGDSWDPGFCKNRDARLGRNVPEAIGAISQDKSPYGVRDMAGGMAEWCMDRGSDGEDTYMVRGGSWGSSEAGCRLATQLSRVASKGYVTLGFRLVHSLRPAKRR